MTESEIINRRIRPLVAVFMAGLIISGVTAIPLQFEADMGARLVGADSATSAFPEPIIEWARIVRDGIRETNERYPFIGYGTDWLAFGHFVIAIAFIGVLIDPLRNKWVVTFGMIACIAVIPMALIAGPLRGIPFWWRCIDCSFGLLGLVPLALAYHYIQRCPSPEPNSGPHSAVMGGIGSVDAD